MSGIDPYKLKISQLRILVAVAEYKNFSEAALSLDISQSAVSHAIATLETQLGIILFHRGRNGADLTFVGEQLVTPAQQILELLQRITTEANRARGLKGGSVTIVSFRSAATHILPPLIARFRCRFPEIKVEVREIDEDKEIENCLQSGKADIGLIHLCDSQELETWKIYHDRYVVLLPKQKAIEHTQLTWQQLAQYPLILPGAGSCFSKINKYLMRSPHPLNIAYQMREDSTILSMAIQGLGAAILPLLAATPVPSQLKIYSLPIPLERTIQAAVVRDALHTPAVFAFMDTLKNERAISE